MAKKEKFSVDEPEAKTESKSVIYFIANVPFLSAGEIEYLRDKPYITINDAWRKFKNFILMAFTNQRQFEINEDCFWRLNSSDRNKFVIGSDALPIELTLMGDYEIAYMVGYDDIRFQTIKQALEKAENISTQINQFTLD